MSAPAISAPAMIPLSVLRDLAACQPLPVDAGAFVKLAAYVAALQPGKGAAVQSDRPIALHVDASADLVQELQKHWQGMSPGKIEVVQDPAPVPPADRKGQGWTTADMHKAAELLQAGKTVPQVAEALGRPIPATRTAIKRYNLRAPAHEIAKGRWGGKPAADAPANDRHDAWTPEKLDELQALKAAGNSWPVIADLMGRTHDACRAQMAILRRKAGDQVAAAGATWTADQDAQLLRARATGQGYDGIAASLGRTVRACQQRAAILRRGDHPAPPAAPRTPGDTPQGNPRSTPAAQPAKPTATPAPTAPKPRTPDSTPPAAEIPKAVAPAPNPGNPDLARVQQLLQAARAKAMPTLQIDVLRHLLSLPADFTPAGDLAVAEGLMVKRKPADIAQDLRSDPGAVLHRWRAMMTAEITDRRGWITLDGQVALLAVLRWRVQQDAGDA